MKPSIRIRFSKLVISLAILLLFVFLFNLGAIREADAGLPTAGASSFLQDQDSSPIDNDGRHDEDHHGHDEGDDDEHDHDEDDDDEHDDDEDDDHDDMDEEEFERHMAELEMEIMHMELEMKHLEMQGYLHLTTEDASKTAFFAISNIDESMDEEAAVELLEECLKESKSDKAKRAMRIKLVELHGDLGNEKVVREHLKALILAQ